jgi:hypothetical protein
MIPENIYLRLISEAAKAPSGHNTQPWKFIIKDDTINICPDYTRALPVVDRDNHALFISLGCALENLIVAAENYGFGASFEIISDNDTPFIRVTLSVSSLHREESLMQYIPLRQVTRGAYSNRKVSEAELLSLKEEIALPGTEVRYIISPEEIESLTPFIIEGSDLQFTNKKFVEELAKWIRFNKRDAERSRDGIWGATMNMPSIPRWMGSFIMKRLVTATSESKRWRKLISASAGFAMFMVEKDDVEHWIALGRSFQRFGLITTKMEIKHAHVNMPCEEVTVRRKLAAMFCGNNITPLLLVRFGYGDTTPYSFRRGIPDIVANEK